MTYLTTENSQKCFISPNGEDITVVNYNESYKDKWDRFISNAKNGYFIFNRDYMDYHSYKFKDFSLMFFKKNKLIGVLPANIKGKTVISHAGLTFGGVVSDKKMKIFTMLEIFEALKRNLKENKIQKLIYKPIPHIFHTSSAQEDLYTLFINRATLIRRDISSCIYNGGKIGFSRVKKRNIKKCKLHGVTIERSFDFKGYMSLKKEDLEKRHGVKPVHIGDEMSLLANNFSKNIKLFVAKKRKEMLAGAIIYETENVAHVQYLASTDEGKKLFASDLLFDYLINGYYKNKKYFDFGISTENRGYYLNEGLIKYKERFGACALAYDSYEVDII